MINQADNVGKPVKVMAIFPSRRASKVEMRELATLIKPSLLGATDICVRIAKDDPHADFLTTCTQRWGTPRLHLDRSEMLDGATHVVCFSQNGSLEFKGIIDKCSKRQLSLMDLRYSV